MPDITVKYFDSTMSGAPALSGTAGTLIGVLDACLINGFGTVTLNSLVVSNNVATATVNAGHQLTMIGTIGPVITIAGATPSGLNGEWRLASVPNSTTCTFVTSGISNQTATGTITIKRSGVGQTKLYSGTNKAVYQNAGTGFCLRVDDSTTGSATVRGYETMTDVDTGDSPFPTVAQLATMYWRKSSTTDGTVRPWWMTADSRAFWLFIASTAGYANAYAVVHFGDFISAHSSDPYACSIIGSSSSANSGQGHNEANAAQAGHYVARSQDGLAKSVQFAKTKGGYAGAQAGWMGSTIYSALASLAGVPTVASPLLIVTTENTYFSPRGILPGVFSVHRHPTSGTHGETLSDGNSLLMLGRGTNDNELSAYAGVVAVKMDGWR